jgi:ribosomal protein L12E/L44/L45/RPP1/RPP2
VAKKKTESQKSRLENQLIEAIKQIDEEGLIFLLQQANILIHNVQVDKLNRELVELQEKQAESGKRGGKKAAAATPTAAAAPVSIEESENGKTFFLTLGGARKVMNLEEMRRIVRICYAAETKSDALRQLYTVFSRERSDILADAKISGPKSPLIEGLFRAVRSTYQLKDR